MHDVERPSGLFFVLKGPVEIDKEGVVSEIDGGVFIAEVAFLTDQPASATVRLGPGAEYLGWELPALRRVLHRQPGLKAALIASLNVDLARKVAQSQPGAQGI